MGGKTEMIQIPGMTGMTRMAKMTKIKGKTMGEWDDWCCWDDQITSMTG